MSELAEHPEPGLATPTCADVLPVILAFHPNAAHLEGVIGTLLNVVSRVAVVDNGGAQCALRPNPQIVLLGNSRNVGVAEGFNIGLRYAIERGYRDALLLDQDSAPTLAMVQGLKRTIDALRDRGRRVATVGPRLEDPRTGRSVPVYCDGVRGIELTATHALPQDELLAVLFLASSGTLVDLQAVGAVGELRSDFFIDCVDFEWGFRARAAGYEILLDPGQVMLHTIGDEPVTVLGRAVTMHTPLRHYYFFRNLAYMSRLDYVPRQWKREVALRGLQQIIFYSLLPRNRLQHARKILQGLRDGFRGRLGPYPS